jgi:hypothetical protein
MQQQEVTLFYLLDEKGFVSLAKYVSVKRNLFFTIWSGGELPKDQIKKRAKG